MGEVQTPRPMDAAGELLLQDEGLKLQLVGGLITHLRSVPIGLRVSDHLTIEFPDLLDFELDNVKKELEIGLQTLEPDIKQNIPEKVYNATISITAAYAAYWADRLENPSILRPFDRGGFSNQGMELRNIMANVPADPAHDQELIDRWAEYLGIRNWYNWLPYLAP